MAPRLIALLAIALLIFGGACGLIGEDDKDNGATATPAPGTTSPAANSTPVGGTPGAASSVEQALQRWVENRLNVGFIPDCEKARRPDDVGKQCAHYRGERNGLRAYELGPTFSEYTRLIILQPVGDSWTIAQLENRDPNGAPVPGVPWPLEVGATVIVAGTAPDCLRVRERAGTQAPQVACLEDGIVVTIAEGPVDIDSLEWWRLEGYGWAASNWLRYPEDVPDLEPVTPETG